MGTLTHVDSLECDGAAVMSLGFKRGYVAGDEVEGTIEPELDAGLALFFVWLVYVFRNLDQNLVTAPPAMS